jgi:hypothetical protein
MTMQDETPATELHLITWDDFFPCHTDATELRPIPLHKDDKPNTRAMPKSARKTDSNSKHPRLAQPRSGKKPIHGLRQTKIIRRSTLARRKLETPGKGFQGTAESPLLNLATAELAVGNKEKARQLLRQVLRANPRFEPGWLWMADAVDSDEERRFCLEQVLALDRRNALARRRLEALTASVVPLKHTDSAKSIKAQTELSISENRLSGLRATPQKYAIPIAIIYLGVLLIVEAFSRIVPQARLVFYGVLLAVLIAHIALTWRHTRSHLILLPSLAPLVRTVSIFSD